MDNVVVTGASRGIGLGVARKLAASGYHVIAVARVISPELTAAIEETGKDALTFEPFDLGEIDVAVIRNLEFLAGLDAQHPREMLRLLAGNPGVPIFHSIHKKSPPRHVALGCRHL